MGYTVGRLIDHIGIWASDYPASVRFYRATFEALGLGPAIEEGEGWMALDELYIAPVRGEAVATRGLHLCFQAAHRAAVARFHAAGLAAGGRDHGAPGLRDYHSGYYAAFLLDPDGNNIEAKLDERVRARSTPAITMETD